MESAVRYRLPPVPEHLRETRLTKGEAAVRIGIARSTLYRLIEEGVIEPEPDGRVDVAKAVPRYEAYRDRIEGRRW